MANSVLTHCSNSRTASAACLRSHPSPCRTVWYLQCKDRDDAVLKTTAWDHNILPAWKLQREKKKDCYLPWVVSSFIEHFTELGCNWAHASTAFWISLGKWLHITATSEEKCKCCTHLRNTVILSVRGLTLVNLEVQKYIYIWGNPYMPPISTNPLININWKHFPFMSFYFLPHSFWNMDFLFRVLRKLRTLSWLTMNINIHTQKDWFPVSHFHNFLLVNWGTEWRNKTSKFLLLA